MDTLRSQADAVLVGASTLRSDDYPMQVRTAAAKAERLRLGKPAGLVTVVVSASLRLPITARFFQAPLAPFVVLATTDDAEAGHLQLGPNVELWRLGKTQVDLPRLCARLHERGVERLLVEGGGAINWQFLQHDLLDEVHLTLTPALLGGRGAPTWLEGDGLPMAQHRRLHLVSAKVVAGEIYCRYRLLPAY